MQRTTSVGLIVGLFTTLCSLNVINGACLGNDPMYFGQWQVTRIIPISAGSALSQTEAEALIGLQASFDRGVARSGKEECKDPIYKESSLSQAEFAIGTRVSATQLGITGDDIMMVTVGRKSHDVWDAPGNRFFVKDPNTLIVIYGGVYFEMRRKTTK